MDLFAEFWQLMNVIKEIVHLTEDLIYLKKVIIVI